MAKPGEYKTIQTRILKYAEEIGWREEAETRRGFDPEAESKDRAKRKPLFFDDKDVDTMTNCLDSRPQTVVPACIKWIAHIAETA